MKKADGKSKERTTFTTSELQESIREALDRVQFKGERIFVTRWGRPAAVLAPLSPAEIARLEESAA